MSENELKNCCEERGRCTIDGCTHLVLLSLRFVGWQLEWKSSISARIRNMELNRRAVWLSLVSLAVVLGVEVYVYSLGHWYRVKSFRFHIYVFIVFIFYLMCRYIWKKLSSLMTKEWFSLAALPKLILLAILALAEGCIPFGYALMGAEDPPFFNRLSNTCLGIVIFLTTSLVAVDILSFLWRVVLCRVCSGRRDSKNEEETRKLLTLFAVVVTLVLMFTGYLGVSRFTIERVHLPVKDLDQRLNGTTVIQLSDIHLGPFNGRRELLRIVNEVNELQGDLVVITGDLVDSTVAALQRAVKPLSTIRSRYGVYFVPGNHEYYTGDIDNWFLELPRVNVTPLVNKRVCLVGGDPDVCNKGLYLAGLEDIETRRINYGPHSMDLHSALSGRQKGIPTIVLAHQPWAAVEAIMWEDVRLVLSGHTHAGQIFPTIIPVYLYNPFYVGLYEPRPGVYVYVSPGTLYYLVPFRHYRPEITVLTLISV